ncbi:MAG: NADPH-dependent FMN reductase [Bdellovibrionales bacterium]
MKVLGIIGSIRENSIHRMVFNSYKEVCKDHFELIEGEIESIPMYKGKDDEPSVFKLAKQISETDAVIFFSPEYNYSVSGVLKNAIDCLSRVDPQPLSGKHAAIIGASPGAVGTARMQYHLRQIGVFLNLHFLNKPEVMIGKAMDKIEGGKVTDKGTLEFLEKHAAKFKSFIK